MRNFFEDLILIIKIEPEVFLSIIIAFTYPFIIYLLLYPSTIAAKLLTKTRLYPLFGGLLTLFFTFLNYVVLTMILVLPWEEAYQRGGALLGMIMFGGPAVLYKMIANLKLYNSKV